MLNALTIVTEFIGIALAASYLGVPKVVAVILASLVIVLAASTGSLRRFERMAMIFCGGSLLLIPLYVLAHPPVGQMARGFTIPSIPGGPGQLATVMLLVIGIVGTTVAPWQLFFQQSYIIDKRITPRFMRYEKADLWIGIVVVVIGGGALMGATAAAFAGVRHVPFTDAAGLAAGLSAYAGHAAGAMFAVALLDASMIGAFAVSLSTAYAVGDMLGPEALAAPRREAGKGLLRDVRGADRARRRDRADPRLPARAAHRRRAGAGRRAAAERDGLPAVALQRQGSARPLGERQGHQRAWPSSSSACSSCCRRS